MLSHWFEDALLYATQCTPHRTVKAPLFPYISHLLGVASIVIENGAHEDEAVAALLHDAIEDHQLRCRNDDSSHEAQRVVVRLEPCLTGFFVAMLTILICLSGALAASVRFGIGDIGWGARNQNEEEPAMPKPIKEEIPPTLEPSTRSVPPGYSSQIIHVKFREGTQVDAPETLVPVGLRDLVASIRRLFSLPEQELENIRGRGETRSGRTLPDLNLWFQITLKPDVDAARFLDELKRVHSVESAQHAPLSTPPPMK